MTSNERVPRVRACVCAIMICCSARKHLAEIQHHRRSVIPEDERAKLEEVAYKLSDDEDEASAETEHQHHVIDAASNFVSLSASNQDAKIVRKALGSQLTAIHVQLPCLLTRPPDLVRKSWCEKLVIAGT